MAKAIYVLKMALLASEVPDLRRQDKEGVRRMALFVSLVYVQHWHEAVLPIRAPLNDVRLILTLEQCPDKVCSVPAIRAIYRHHWYLSEDLIGLVFPDDRVDHVSIL